jgi:DNA polymerase-3 subunit epsilon
VLTGDMSMDRDQIKALADRAGLRVTGSVSGMTALVVAADPWSQSGKARAARQLGVRLVTEQVFLYYLEQILAGQLESRPNQHSPGRQLADGCL